MVGIFVIWCIEPEIEPNSENSESHHPYINL